jgi:hypothetical protein
MISLEWQGRHDSGPGVNILGKAGVLNGVNRSKQLARRCALPMGSPLEGVPDAQDLLGLTRQQYRADPHQATAARRPSIRGSWQTSNRAGIIYDQYIADARNLRVIGTAG